MQQYLAQELRQIASMPSVEELMDEVGRRQSLDRVDVSVESILDAIDADRT